MPLHPPDHPQRFELAAEVHARPPPAARAPAVITCLALTDAPATQTLAAVRRLADGAVSDEATPVAHLRVEVGDLAIKWERHGEFVSLTFVQPLAGLDLGALAGTEFPTALTALPPGWLAALPGRTIACADVLLIEGGAEEPRLESMGRWFDTDALAGASVLGEAAWLFTDFLVKDSGRTRWLALDVRLGRAQSARVVQRIAEIETYRMMALLGFPLARAALPQLDDAEQRLQRITADIAALQPDARDPAAHLDEEQRLLYELTRLAAEVERSVAATAFRFSAAQAYWEIVRARLSELREQRLGDLRTLSGFLARRMAPAMNSCAAASRRQEAISARIERASSLLRTRVDIAREEQNQRLLAAMERRSKQQLRLQQTVEGLSVAAITYYAAGLVNYVVQPLAALLPPLVPDLITAASIPLVALAVWLGLRKIRARLRVH